MQHLDIGEIAQRSGLPASTLRFYEEKGLIASSGRRGLRRQFDARTLERLELIGLGQAAGLSLDEIGSMFPPDGKIRIDRELLEQKARQMDQAIRRLSAMRDGLRHAAACPEPDHMHCPTFLRLLKIAASGKLGRGKQDSAGSARIETVFT